MQWYYTHAIILVDYENSQIQNNNPYGILKKPILGFLTILFLDVEFILADGLLVSVTSALIFRES